jgi:hypothetical protein
MTSDIKKFIKLLNAKRDDLLIEYNDIIACMQMYDVSSFNSELHSAYKYYSDKYFDEEKFVSSVKRDWGVDLNTPDIKVATFDAVLEFSEAVVLLATLRGYIKYNNILIGEEDDE